MENTSDKKKMKKYSLIKSLEKKYGGTKNSVMDQIDKKGAKSLPKKKKY